jgi:hypothetical protein
MGEVIELDVETKLDIPVSKVLDGAKDLTGIVVIGETAEGQIYFASSMSDGPTINWLIDHAKRTIFANHDG